MKQGSEVSVRGKGQNSVSLYECLCAVITSLHELGFVIFVRYRVLAS